MSKAHKILLGVYLACVFVSLIVLAILLLPLPLGWVKLLASLLISPVVLGILFTPFFLSASGTRQTYQSFFTPFILENCKRQGTAKPFLECQIDNRISLSQLFPKSTTLDKIEAGF